MRTRSFLLTAALIVGAFAGLAADLPDDCRVTDEGDPATAEDDIVVCEQRVYFHCDDDAVKVNNANLAAAGWDTTPPDRSVTEGAGCGQLDTTITGTADHNPLYDAPFAGWFEHEETANVESLTVHAHNIDVGTARLAPESFAMRAHVVVNGQTVLDRETVIRPVPVESETGISREIEFTVTGIDQYDLGQFSTAKVTLYAHFVDTNHNGWVWDTTEVPSGITFNPTEAAAFTIPAGS